VNDHSRHGMTRAAGEHHYDLDGAAKHAGHGQNKSTWVMPGTRMCIAAAFGSP
jgi:hypothetical protein